MKIFYESKLAKWLLWRGYSTITLGFFVFTKKSKEDTQPKTLNHEAIHVRQWTELSVLSATLWLLGFLFGTMPFAGIFIAPFIFYLWYGLEWFIRLAVRCSKCDDDDTLFSEAYHAVSFEREAYGNALNTDYLRTRKPFGFIKFLFYKSDFK